MGTTVQFSVKGMTCGNCVRHVENALQTLEGVSSVTVNLENQVATVQYEPTIASVDRMAKAVNEAGYTLEPKPMS